MQAKTSVNTARGRLLALRARIQTDFFRLQQYCNVRVVDVSASTIAPSGPQGAASLPGECPPAAPIGLAGATMEPGVRDAGFWQRRA